MSGYCGACNKPLVDETVHVGSKQMHPECFKCTSCKSQIKGAFFTEPHGYYCTECMQGSSNKWCASCKTGLSGQFRVYKGKNYCSGCREKIQLADKGEKDSHFSQVIHDEKMVAEHNRRAAAATGPAQSGKFDYKEYHHSIESEKKW
eukprot:Mycagemm_TRINITY_DN10385_c0_g3::TRINITY_DN10385_c0_g3_i1::g.1398::m.1398 type:complete len:147 gc:universal TRINITY_DN10385_c0_g3_i1:516-76(-)